MIKAMEATEFAATLNSYVTVYSNWPPSIGKITPTKNKSRVIISIRGPKR